MIAAMLWIWHAIADLAALTVIVMLIWNTIEVRRLQRMLDGIDAKEVVASARMVSAIAPTMLRALHGVQQAWQPGVSE
jgi:hypothetical protein